MKSVTEISATEVMEETPATVSTDASVTKVKSTMERESLRTIPVVNNGKLRGAVSYRDLIRHMQFNPEKVKIETVMHQPPEFENSDSLIDLANLRINSGRKMLVKAEDGNFEGKIGDREFRHTFKDAEEVQKVNTRRLGSDEVVKTFEEESIEEARHKMLDNNISRLPVLDNNGNLTTMIDSVQMLKAVVPMQSQGSGGTSGKSLKDTQMAGGSEKESMSDISVEEIMNRTPVTSDGHMKGEKAIELMNENDSNEIIVLQDEYPVSIVAVKDFIDYVADFRDRNTVLVQITGLELPEEKAVVHDKIATQMRGGLGRKIKRPEEITLRIKKAEKDGKKHRYELTLKLQCEYGLITAQEEGWELMDVLDTALETVDTQVRKKKDKRDEHRN